MARGKAGAPAGNGKQRDVDRRDLAHLRKESRVAREVDTRPSVDDVAEGRRARRKRPPTGLVLGVGGANPDGPERQFFAHLELEDTPEPSPSHETTDTARRDNGQVAVETAQRPEIEVVVMRVRKEDRVEVSEGVCGDGPLAPQVPDARSQNRVGDDPRALEVDHDGAVPEPGQPAQRSSA